jgi:Zn finger protein HypA/HybF involved in hydrogenase expression
METSADKNAVLTAAVANRIIAHCKKMGLSEPIVSVALLRSKLSEIHLTNLEASLKDKGSQWERIRIDYKDVPARVECNTCGTRFTAHADWNPCSDCGNPGAFTVIRPYHLKLKAVRTDSGIIVKAKRDTVLL